jgi:hypothetical protein
LHEDPPPQWRNTLRASTSTQEMTMSQKAPHDPDVRRAPTQKLKAQDKPSTDLPPDEDVEVTPDEPGKPEAPLK